MMVALGAIAVVSVLFVVLRGGDDDGGEPTSTQAPATQTQTTQQTGPTADVEAKIAIETVIKVRNGKPVGGVKRLEYSKGERIRFQVRSDVGDEVHVHGYDRSKDVEPGGTVRFSFPATLEGVFEVELESRAEPIAELRVKPS